MPGCTWATGALRRGEWPRCKLIAEETAKELKARQEAHEALFREVNEILEGVWKDSDGISP